MLYNIEAENAVLGAFLNDGALIEEVTLHNHDFYDRSRQVIFEAMKKLRAASQNIDLVSLTVELSDRGQLENVGGTQLLSDLANSIPTTGNLTYYVNILKEKSYLRQALAITQQIQAAITQELSPDKVKEALTLFDTLSLGAQSVGKEIRDVSVASFQEIEDRHANSGEITGISTGMPELDRILSGLHETELMIVAARPSVGKTAFVTNIGDNVAEQDHCHVDMYSLEMPAEKLFERQLAANGNINGHNIRTGMLSMEDWGKMSMAMGTLSTKNMTYYDNPFCTIDTIRNNTRETRRKYPDKRLVVIIDYLQLLSYVGSSNNRNDQVSYMSRELKKIAGEFKASFVVLSQLSRGVEQRQDKRPMMSDLRESGAIEQDADTIIFLYRDDYYDKESENKNIIDIIVGKQRNGPIGTVQMAFVKEYQKMVTLERRFADQDE